MQVILTKPIEDFIEKQLSLGYPDVNAVVCEAFYRWMAKEDAEPIRLRDKLLVAHNGTFRAYEPHRYDTPGP